jgi:hypothetical protein
MSSGTRSTSTLRRRGRDHRVHWSSGATAVADARGREQLLTALTTEHFTLQTARSQTVNESSSRAALYVGALSSAVVTLGFITQASRAGHLFQVFALTVLPTLYLLGIFTFVRLVENSAEDFRYGMAINRVRGYYQQLAGDQEGLFLLSGHDDAQGVMANMAVPSPGRQRYFTFATAVAVINSVVIGSSGAIAVAASTGWSLGPAVAVGGLLAVVSLSSLLRLATHLLATRASEVHALFPSPDAADRGPLK